MLQYRRNDPSRRRKIKRDLASAPKKGVAGLRMEAAVEDTKVLSAALDTLNIDSEQTDNHRSLCRSLPIYWYQPRLIYLLKNKYLYTLEKTNLYTIFFFEKFNLSIFFFLRTNKTILNFAISRSETEFLRAWTG